MKTLKKSLLDKTRNKVVASKELFDNMLFGKMFRFKEVTNLSENCVDDISEVVLKNLTKDMDYINTWLKNMKFNSKVKMLCNYIEHINVIKWGFEDVDWEDKRVKVKFCEKINETLHKLGVFPKHYILTHSYLPQPFGNNICMVIIDTANENSFMIEFIEKQ